jgi:DNA (cytosine-5)-methyltransferase 1
LKPTYIDLYAGCGGLSLGMMNAGWTGLFAIEKNKDAFSTLKHNLIDNKSHFYWPNWLPISTHDIDELIKKYQKQLTKLKGKVNLVAGGPPCQGFSTAGKRNESDERNKLIYSYINFIKIIKPNLIFFENVKGFTYSFSKSNTKGIPYSQIVISELEKLGYKIKPKVIDFSEYGIPQRRKRFILVGALNFELDNFFQFLEDQRDNFLAKKSIKSKVTVEEAISDLLRQHGTSPSPDSRNFKAGIYSGVTSNYQNLLRNNNGEMGQVADSHRFVNHSQRIKDRFDYLIKNAPHDRELKKIIAEKYNSKKRTTVVLNKNGICPTLTSLPDDCIHYSEPRILTVREYARLQSFPDWFEFKGKYTTGAKLRKIEVPRYTQIGNAIPPLFVDQVGYVLKDLIKDV